MKHNFILFKNYSLISIIYFFLVSLNLCSQNYYSGFVIEQNGEPILGASVFLKNSTIGTLTDINGEFSLNANINDVIVISYIGFENEEFTLTAKKDLGRIILIENIEQLDEVVVIGYGNQNKEILTGSVSSISGDKLSLEPIVNASQALQGKAAGVQIIASDAPGAASQVIIRGLGTIQGGRDPLYVVDGVLTNNINNINTNDIDNISILKDAASLAIYGNRGANGVVIVSTKKGQNGKFTINVNSNFGIRDINYKILMGDSDSFVTFSNEAIYWAIMADSDPSNDNNLNYFFPQTNYIILIGLKRCHNSE